MSAAVETAEVPTPAAKGRGSGLLRRAEGARHLFGIILLVVGVLLSVYLLVASAYADRASYYHDRNLRELDRLKATIQSATDTLSAVPKFHLAPSQLHFAISPTTGCLVATTSIGGGSSRPIDIVYHLVPPPPAREVEPAPSRPDPSAAGPDRVPQPGERCTYRRLVPGTDVSLSEQSVTVKGTLQLSAVLWPTTAPGIRPDGLASCSGEPATGLSASPTSFVQGCFLAAAHADLRARPPPIPPGEAEHIARRSILAAIANRGIHVEVTTSSEALDLANALATFDAILLVGEKRQDADARPAVLFQAGQIPPLIEDDSDALPTSFLASLLAEGKDKSNRSDRPGPRSQAPEASPAGTDSLLTEASVHRTGGLVIFQKKYTQLGSLSCGEERPCRLIGVVADRKFNRTVRRIGGYQAAGFLIGVLSIIGLIPLIQLALRKRLDPMAPTTQYIIWFSLTLMSASAAIAGLTFWSNTAARHSSDRHSREAIELIRTDFHKELSSWVERIGRAGRVLPKASDYFPAPQTYPSPRPAPDAAAVEAAAVLLDPKSIGILETVEYFRRDGFNEPGWQRIALNRFPAFGTNIRDRAYFARALKNDWNEFVMEDGRKDHFVLDRVVARPDAMVKTIMMRPASEVGVPAGLQVAGRPRQEDPAAPDFVLSAGHLQTFLAAATAPGFDYAVIDPTRPAGKPNVLFHSRNDAELVEWFQNELDGERRFAALIDKALAERRARDYRCIRGARPAPEAGKPCRPGILRLSTYYRAEPVRLSLIRLHPSLDWIVIFIEQRNDSGTAAWRAASFGYITWLIALLMLLFVNLAVRMTNPRALDRRPGMWLWPRTALTDFTAFRSAEERHAHTEIEKATHRRNRHIASVCIYGALAVFATEGVSRTFAALGAVMAGYAARAYFRGSTAHSRTACRKLDLYSIRIAWVLLSMSLVTGAATLADDMRSLDGEAGRVGLDVVLRVIFYLLSLAAIGRSLIHAGWYADDERAQPAPAERSGNAVPGTPSLDGESADTAASHQGRSWIRRVSSFLVRKLHLGKRAAARYHKASRLIRGWMLVPLLAGAVPAAAGYLDSIDHDFALVAERSGDRLFQTCEQRRTLIGRINETRLRGERFAIPKPIVDKILASAAPDVRGSCLANGPVPAGPVHEDAAWRTASGLAMSYPALHDRALEFSDHVPFHMRDTWGGGKVEVLFTLLVMLLPFVFVTLIYAYFRRQYFPASPQAPPGKAGDLEPPLTCSRQCLIEALVEVVKGNRPPRRSDAAAPLLPFRNVPERRHVVLGVDLDLREEEALAKLPGIVWVDLLHVPEKGLAPGMLDKADAVVVGNLDIALQLEKRPERLLEVLEEIVGAPDDKAAQQRYVFILAAIEPLDRIALLRERTAEEKDPRRVHDLRWAAILQDFALCAVTPDQPTSLPTLADRELKVINTRFARALYDSLPVELTKPDLASDKEDSLVAYVAEQLGDFYHKLWASSSNEERVLLFHLAWRFHLKMEDSRALRSLLARGLIVRTPEYRLMNRSFARYVRRVERSELIHSRAAGADGIDQTWPLIRYPLAAFVASMLIVLQLVAPSQSSGTVGLLPALGAAIPALIANWLRGKNVQV